MEKERSSMPRAPKNAEAATRALEAWSLSQGVTRSELTNSRTAVAENFGCWRRAAMRAWGVTKWVDLGSHLGYLLETFQAVVGCLAHTIIDITDHDAVRRLKARVWAIALKY
jgi:hypothetical protein